MDDSNSSTWQTLAGALAGGLQGYVDSQGGGFAVTQPTPQTAYGYAGYQQPTAAGSNGLPSWVIPVALVAVVAVLLFKK